ncbi:MAG: peptidoglycan-binding domain-containing protein [Minisyncoccia bacterium]
MRIFFSALSIFLLFSYGPRAFAQTSALNIFSSNLSIGASGVSVTALQEELNRDPDTQIASAGPGSPGNETGYFGALTKAAVIRFQNKYAAEVLAPAGLAEGSGFVGLYTRTKLNALAATPPATPAGGNTTSSSPSASSTAAQQTSAAAQNPNTANLDAFIATVDAEGVKEGFSSSSIAAANEKIREVAATTTDLRAKFINVLQQNSRVAKRDDSIAAKILAFLTRLFVPERAYASFVGVPFGGIITFALPCNDGWNVAITPLPPTMVSLLTYIMGSQAFPYYTLNGAHPGMGVVGSYTPGPGACVLGIIPIPSEGIISPFTSSSP